MGGAELETSLDDFCKDFYYKRRRKNRIVIGGISGIERFF